MQNFINEIFAYFGTPTAFKEWLAGVRSDCDFVTFAQVREALPNGYKLVTRCDCNYDVVYAESLTDSIYVGKTYDGKKIYFK